MDVALSHACLDAQIRQSQGEIVLGIAAVWVVVTTMIAWMLQRSYGGLGEFLRAVQGHSETMTKPFNPQSPLRKIGALATAINALLTRVQKREEEVSRIEAVCRSTVEDAVVGSWQSTPEGRVVSANRAMAQIYGYETTEEFMQEVGELQS